MTGLDPSASPRDEQWQGARSAHALPATPTRNLLLSVWPAIVIAVLSVGGVVFVLAGNASTAMLRTTLFGITGGIALMLIAAWFAANSATQTAARQASAARAQTQRNQAELRQMAERILRGEHIAPVAPVPAMGGGDQFQLLTRDLAHSQYAASQAVLSVADRVFRSWSDQRVEIFVNLARRMQSLVHREIELLDDLEAQVEDPDLLKGLFTIDHLATRMRRQSESLAVLGGSTSRRQWNRQVTLHEVLRAAVAEVEMYSRVKVVPPVEGVLRGDAVSDIIHLIAELVENATKFSAPRTQVLLRAQRVTAGVVIEVEDRGLGMLPPDQDRMNALLADPGQVDIDELLRDGRIGLYVVSTLSIRHGVRVQLQTNIYGGIQAVMVLPWVLLEAGEGDQGQRQSEAGRQPARELVTAGSSSKPPAFTPPAGWPAVADLSGSQAPAPVSQAAVSQVPDSTAPIGHTSQVALPAAARPPLPKRQAQTHLAPELRSEAGVDGTTPNTDEPPAEQMPGLMADFLRGINRAGEED